VRRAGGLLWGGLPAPRLALPWLWLFLPKLGCSVSSPREGRDRSSAGIPRSPSFTGRCLLGRASPAQPGPGRKSRLHEHLFRGGDGVGAEEALGAVLRALSSSRGSGGLTTQPPGEQIAQEFVSALEGVGCCYFFPGGGALLSHLHFPVVLRERPQQTSLRLRCARARRLFPGSSRAAPLPPALGPAPGEAAGLREGVVTV